MKSFLKKNIKLFVGIIVGIILSSGVVYAINANLIEYTPQDENWNVNNVTDALNNLYTEKHFSAVTFLGKNTVNGNTTMTYTFNEDVDLGFVVITASNNIDDSSYYSAQINSLTIGNYQVLDNTTRGFITSDKDTAGHRSIVYVIEEVKKDSVLTVATRYAGIVQVFKIN